MVHIGGADLLQSSKHRGAKFYYFLSILDRCEAEILDIVLFCSSKFYLQQTLLRKV